MYFYMYILQAMYIMYLYVPVPYIVLAQGYIDCR